MNDEQRKAMFAKQGSKGHGISSGIRAKTNDNVYIHGEPVPRKAFTSERQDAEEKKIEQFEKEVNRLKLPDNSWKEKALKTIYLGKHKDFTDFKTNNGTGEIISEKDQLMYEATIFPPLRDLVWHKAFPTRDDDSIRFSQGYYFGIRLMPKSERQPLIEAIKSLTPQELENGYLEQAEIEIQVHGNNPPFFDDVMKFLPDQHRKFILEGKKSTTPQREMIKRIKIIRNKLGHNERIWNSDIDERYTRIRIPKEEYMI